MFDFPFDAIPERFKFGNMLIWNYKNNVKPNDQHRYKYTYEPIFYFYGKDAPTLNLPKNKEWDAALNSYDVFTIAQPQSNFTDKKEHPTQKPIELFKQLMAVGSEIGDTILDCFAGSGTAGECAKSLKRKAILIEKDPAYIKIINRRISQ
jgi:DNA modification methylase